MDSSFYKDVTTSRGLEYHYLLSPAQGAKPVLLLLHGFPSTSYDWRYQITFFRQQGPSLICKDIIDILDTEKVDQCIMISHDWGSKIGARLANLYIDRFIAFAFLVVPYSPPRPNFNLEETLAMTKKAVGHELIGYWKFFSEDEADKLVESKWDSFFSIGFPSDLDIWKTDLAPTGTLKAWLQADKRTPLPSYITEEDKKIQTNVLLKGGLAAPLCWYKVMTSGINADDDKFVPLDTYEIHKPVFFGAAKQDYVAIVALGKLSTAQFCKDATIREFEGGHWIIFSAKDEVNKELLVWIEGVQDRT